MKCFESKDVIPQEAKVSEQLEFIDLNDGEKVWTEKILLASLEKKNTYNDLKEKGYIIKNMIIKLEENYNIFF